MIETITVVCEFGQLAIFTRIQVYGKWLTDYNKNLKRLRIITLISSTSLRQRKYERLHI